MSLSDCQFLHSPALSVKLVYAHIVICDIPVGTYHTVIAILFTEKVGDYIFAVAVSYIFSRRVDTC